MKIQKSAYVLTIIVFILNSSIVFGSTLKEVLIKNNINYRDIKIENINKEITSYAVLNDPKYFSIAYYLDDGSKMLLGDKLYIFLLKKDKNIWIDRTLNIKTLNTNIPHFLPGGIGGIHKIDYSNDYVYLTAKYYTLILSNKLKFQNAFWGWFLCSLGNETILYKHIQPRSAPTYYLEISTYNIHTKHEKKIYPMKPYQRIRLDQIQKIQGVYDKYGTERFGNHHLDAELFDNSLASKIAINDENKSIAFIVDFYNKDYWKDEDISKSQCFSAYSGDIGQ